MSNKKFTFDDAVAKIDLLNGTPIAVEAQWDGDTQGWHLMMFVISKPLGTQLPLSILLPIRTMRRIGNVLAIQLGLKRLHTESDLVQ